MKNYDERFGVRLGQERHGRLHALAKQRGMSAAEVVREAIDRASAELESESAVRPSKLPSEPVGADVPDSER